LKKNCKLSGSVDLKEGEYLLEVKVCNTASACESKEVRFRFMDYEIPEPIFMRLFRAIIENFSKWINTVNIDIFTCFDGLDNDGDGYTDSDDDKCDNALSVGEKYNKDLEIEYNFVKEDGELFKLMLGLLKIEINPWDLPEDITVLKVKIRRVPYISQDVLSFNDQYIIDTPDYPEGIVFWEGDQHEGMMDIKLIYKDEDPETPEDQFQLDVVLKNSEGRFLHGEGSMLWEDKNGIRIHMGEVGRERRVEGYNFKKYTNEGFEIVPLAPEEDPLAYEPAPPEAYQEVTDPIEAQYCGSTTYCILGCESEEVQCPTCYKIDPYSPYFRYCCYGYPRFHPCGGDCTSSWGDCHNPSGMKCRFEVAFHDEAECWGWVGLYVEARPPRKRDPKVKYNLHKYQIVGNKCEDAIDQFKFSREINLWNDEEQRYKKEKFPVAARTDCKIKPKYQGIIECNERDEEYCCEAKGVHYYAFEKMVIVEMPEWKSVPDECKDNWNKFIDELKLHEAEHEKICNTCFDEFNDYLNYDFPIDDEVKKVCGKKEEEAKLKDKVTKNVDDYLQGVKRKWEDRCSKKHDLFDSEVHNTKELMDKLTWKCPCQ